MTMNLKLRDLLARKERQVSFSRGITDAAARQGRDLTEAERAQVDQALLALDEINAQIKAEHEKIEAERTAPAIGGPGARTGLSLAGAIAIGPRYAQMFPDAHLNAGGFDSMGDFLRTLHNGLADPRMVPAASSGASEGVGADGGYLVPTRLVAELMDASLEDEIVRPRAALRPMDTNSAYVSGFNTLNHSSSIGGFAAGWLGEGGSLSAQKGLVRSLTLYAKKLGILTAATNELLADSPYFERELIPLLAKAIGWYLDLAFLTGSGVGEPLGVLNDPALITVNKEASQPAATITWNNLKAMFGRLHPASHKNAVWVANNAAKVELLGLVQLVKNVAGTENVGGSWIPVMRDDGNGGFTILGLPVLFTEKTPTLGTVGDIILADFSQYIVGLRKEMTLDKSGHLGFQTDETYYRAILRADGMGRWNAAMTPKAGSTLSWAVVLQTR